MAWLTCPMTLFCAGGNITVYSDGEVDSKGKIAMDPVAKGGYELAAYDIFHRFAEANKVLFLL